MKKTVVEYITNTLEDIPKQSLQTNKRRLHAFFSEQETIEKRGTHFVFRYAFYSVEKLRRPTKQSLFKEYNTNRSKSAYEISVCKKHADLNQYS